MAHTCLDLSKLVSGLSADVVTGGNSLPALMFNPGQRRPRPRYCLNCLGCDSAALLASNAEEGMNLVLDVRNRRRIARSM